MIFSNKILAVPNYLKIRNESINYVPKWKNFLGIILNDKLKFLII